jgi:hypothetical protein
MASRDSDAATGVRGRRQLPWLTWNRHVNVFERDVVYLHDKVVRPLGAHVVAPR